jgi:hypothetical protein
VVCVEAASEGSVDADLRLHCKYLSHIPEGADVVFIEASVLRDSVRLKERSRRDGRVGERKAGNP